MQLHINGVIGWKASSSADDHVAYARIVRILGLDPGGQTVIAIDLRQKKGIPKPLSVSDLHDAFIHKDIDILEDDPELVHRDEETLSDADKAARDEVWAALEPYLLHHADALLNKRTRGALVAKIMKETTWSKKTVYRYLRQYWQFGQTKNAFVPGFYRCGGKGKRRLIYKSRCGPERKAKALGWSSDHGVPVDEEIRRRLMQGIQEFFIEPGKTRGFPKAYEDTIRKYFHDGFELKNGILQPTLWNPGRLPSVKQARRVLQTDFKNVEQLIKDSEGEKAYLTKYRPLMGESLDLAEGPGSLYQIDATIGDIYLRSEIDRNWLIGRPVIYLVADVFSRMIVGFAVLFEGPSWLGAREALLSAYMNKEKFCEQFGLTIASSAWPCEGLPETLLADCGELLSHNADSLTDLGVLVYQAAPWRPDWKGIVEQYFHLVHGEIAWVPGKLRSRKPGEHDCRLDGRLTPRMFRQLLIGCILEYNLFHVLKQYPLSGPMIQDGLRPTPLNVWRWGIENSTCRPKWKPEELVRKTLLPRGKATITRRGIRFQDLYYTCARAESEQWYIRAAKRQWKVDVSYYPPNNDTIFLRSHDSKNFEPCTLVDRTNERAWKGNDWYDTRDYFEVRRVQALQASYSYVYETKEVKAIQHDIVMKAEAEFEEAKLPHSKSAQLADINLNRKNEVAYEQGDRTASVPALPAPMNRAPSVEDDAYVPPDEPLELLQELQQASFSSRDT